MSLKEISIALQSGIETGNRSAEVHISPLRYIQHNLGIGDGKDAILALMDQLPTEGMRARPLRAIEDGALTAVHVDYDFFGPKAGMDVHRFENGMIVEHWDNFQDVPDAPNPAGRTMFDGPTDNGDASRTDEAKETVRAFVETVAIGRDWTVADDFFAGDHLAQHHPLLDDGASSYLSYLGAGPDRGGDASYETLHMVIGEGELVLAVSEGAIAGEPHAFFDLFRLRAGKLDELWTVTEAIPPRYEWRNDNGKF